MTRRRRFAFEALEPRLVLDSIGLGDVAHGGPDWQSVIVSLKDSVVNPRAAGQALVAQHGGQLGHVYEYALNGFSAQLPAAAVAALAKNPNVEFVESDAVVQAFAQTLPTGIDRIDVEQNSAANINGSDERIDVDIAIIDSGIDSDHLDLNVVDGTRFYTVTTGRSRGSYQDDHYDDDFGHGTHVAGIAAALDNDIGVVGVAPGARLWAVRVLDSSGYGNVSDIVKGVDWVTQHAGEIEVANMSLGFQGASLSLRQAIQGSVAAGVVYVAAAGNSSADIHGPDKVFDTSDDFIPAAYPEVATISAFADSDGLPGWDGPDTSWGVNGQDDYWWRLSNFSNTSAFAAVNPVTSPGLGIDLVLPGVDIYSTYKGGGYATMSGTSMAAPHAAGLAALYIASHQRATDALGVYAIRQALIDGGKAWYDPDYGIFSEFDGYYQGGTPDGYRENLGWAGDPVVNLAPTVTIVAPVDPQLWDVDIVTISATAVAAAGTEVTDVRFEITDENGEVVVTLPGVQDQPDSDAWSVAWDTDAVDAEGKLIYPDGSYTIAAQATSVQTGIQEPVYTAGTSLVVSLDEVDNSPTVEITSPGTGTGVSGTVNITADATDDRGVDQVLFFAKATLGDATLIGTDTNGTDGWSISWDTTAIEDDAYAITAVATDTGGNSVTSAAVSVTVDNSFAPMTASLSGTAQTVNARFWRAQVTVTVVNSANAGLLGAVVVGRWNSDSSTVSGSTDTLGQLTFTSGNLRTNVASIDFTLENVTLQGYVYESGAISIRVGRDGIATPLSASLYDQLAVWQAAEQSRTARPKDRSGAIEIIDYLMAFDM